MTFDPALQLWAHALIAEFGKSGGLTPGHALLAGVLAYQADPDTWGEIADMVLGTDTDGAIALRQNIEQVTANVRERLEGARGEASHA